VRDARTCSPVHLHALVLLATLGWSASLFAGALSYSVSESVTMAMGSSSNSLHKSSDSSSGDKHARVQGDYRIAEIVEPQERPGMLRLALQAVERPGADGDLFLYVPVKVAEESGLAVGGIVAAQPRAYGVEFSNGDPRQAFFLVLDDAWHRELQAKAVL
jgi:hypothetical protein